MMTKVKLFAAARQLAGADVLCVELPAGAAVGELRRRLAEQCPALAPLVARAMFAVNADYAADETTIEEHDEIACIPPVSGG